MIFITITYFLGVAIENHDVSAAESLVNDGFSPPGEQMPDVSMSEESAADIPEVIDETQPVVPVHSDNQTDLYAMEATDENMIATDYPNQVEPLDPECEIVLYDELGNRISAKLITIIDDDSSKSNTDTLMINKLDDKETNILNSEGLFNIYIIKHKKLLNYFIILNISFIVYSQLAAEEVLQDKTDETDSNRILEVPVDNGDTNLHEFEISNSSSSTSHDSITLKKGIQKFVIIKKCIYILISKKYFITYRSDSAFINDLQ